jgi:hypothetical protein
MIGILADQILSPLAKVQSGFSGNLQIDKYDMFMA